MLWIVWAKTTRNEDRPVPEHHPNLTCVNCDKSTGHAAASRKSGIVSAKKRSRWVTVGHVERMRRELTSGRVSVISGEQL
jgi:hypothetical protein